MQYKIPETYADWCHNLDLFASGDDGVLESLEQGRFEYEKGGAEQFTVRFNDAYSKRKKAWIDMFNREITLSRPHQGLLQQMLNNTKKNLIPLVRLVKIQTLPDVLRDHYWNDMKMLVQDIKSTIEKQIKSNPKSFHGSNLMELANFNLNNVLSQIQARNEKCADIADSTSPQKPKGRRIIL